MGSICGPRRVVALAACLCCYLPAAAQTVRFEPVVTYEYGYPLAIVRSPGIINQFNTSGNGTSYEHTLGLGASLQMPDLFAENLGLAPRVEYRLAFGKFTSDQFTVFRNDTGIAPIPTTEHFEVRSTTQSIDLTLPLQFSMSTVGLGLGPWASVDVSRSITGTEYIDAPANIRFPGGGTSRQFVGGDTISVSHIHAGLEADVLFRIPLSSSLNLEPRLFGRYDLASSGDVGSKALSVGLSFSLYPNITPTPQSARPPDTLAANARRRSTALEAHVHFTKNGVRTDGRTPIEVVGYNTYFRQYTELPEWIRFEEGSSEISSAYQQVQDRSRTHFQIASLARADLGEFSAQLLNIIGHRMATDSAATLELSAGPRHINDQLLRDRFASVAGYVSYFWKIVPERITSSIAAGNAHRLSDSVWLEGSAVLTPVATQWIERSYHIPHMGIEKSIVAEQGLRSWRVEVRQNANVLAHFDSRDAADENAIADFDLTGDSAAREDRRDPAPIIASLVAEDFEGQRVEASDTLRLPSRQEQQKTMVEREKYVFVFLPDDGPIHANVANTDRMIQKLLSVVHPDAHVTIIDPHDEHRGAGASALSVDERIVSELKRRTDLHPEVLIQPRSAADASAPPYDRAVVVRVDQSK